DPTGTWLYADQTFTQDAAVYRIRIADPSDRAVVATLADPAPKGLDDMTIDAKGILYLAANGTGEVIRLDPSTGAHCTIVTGLQNPSALKFGRGPGWHADRLYVVGFDGAVRELTPPASPAPGPGPGPPSGGPAAPARLALSVRPRSAVAGARTRFRFTVYGIANGKRKRIAGARVIFGGRSARTNGRGRAGLTLRFRHPGRRAARATKNGYAPAVRTVRVRQQRGH
ncbi:MAG: hypothetical protein QOE06_1803, partial [Thermoleophilaceae bacterium]|nr:hypothetical protein [Thermoleophilaceae bacterium]